jgi:hypothetical protein
LSTAGEECSGRQIQVTIPENVDSVDSIGLENRKISIEKIAETLAIFQERAGCIIHEILYMKRLSDKWVPKCFNAIQKRN